jgi:hypothetical protein
LPPATYCLDIKDTGNIATVEAIDLEIEHAASDSDSVSDLTDGVE